MAVDDHVDIFGGSDLGSPDTFWMLAKKLWLPVLFIVIVLTNWEHPIKLAIKAILFLLSTKPMPFSVYLSVEQVGKHFLIFPSVLNSITYQKA